MRVSAVAALRAAASASAQLVRLPAVHADHARDGSRRQVDEPHDLARAAEEREELALEAARRRHLVHHPARRPRDEILRALAQERRETPEVSGGWGRGGRLRLEGGERAEGRERDAHLQRGARADAGALGDVRSNDHGDGFALEESDARVLAVENEQDPRDVRRPSLGRAAPLESIAETRVRGEVARSNPIPDADAASSSSAYPKSSATGISKVSARPSPAVVVGASSPRAGREVMRTDGSDDGADGGRRRWMAT